MPQEAPGLTLQQRAFNLWDRKSCLLECTMCTYVTTQLCLRKQYGTKLDLYRLLQNYQDLLYKLLENQDVRIPGGSKIASVVSSAL